MGKQLPSCQISRTTISSNDSCKPQPIKLACLATFLLIQQNPNAVPSSPRLRKAFMRPAEDSDGARIIDFYLPEEEDVSQVDQMLKEPLPFERIEELHANEQIDDDEFFKPVCYTATPLTHTRIRVTRGAR